MKKTTRIKAILKNPAAIVVMDKHISGFSKDNRLKMAAMMTVEQLAGYVPGWTDKEKEALYADLANVPEE
jgi:hypothetical protein